MGHATSRCVPERRLRKRVFWEDQWLKSTIYTDPSSFWVDNLELSWIMLNLLCIRIFPFSRTYLNKSSFLRAALALAPVVSGRGIDSQLLMQVFFLFLSSKHGEGFDCFPLYLSFTLPYVFLRRFCRHLLGSAIICYDWALISLDYEGTEVHNWNHRWKILKPLALWKEKKNCSRSYWTCARKQV